MRTWLIVPATALLILGGCRLIDQRTFQRTQAPTQAALTSPPLPALPLARLQPANPSSDWRAQVDAIVQQALAQHPNGHFELLTPIPTTATRAVQDRFARDGTADAEAVSTALQEDRIDASQITIGYQGDPGNPAREVRLYLR